MTDSPSPLPIRSSPALAAALRTLDRARLVSPLATANQAERLAPIYQIPGGEVAEEAAAAAYVVSHIVERLRRLAAAYAEWDLFDAPAYFDLSRAHSVNLLRLVERVSTVHIAFFVDLLLPSMHSAAGFWADSFTPAYAQMRVEPQQAAHFYACLQPEMVERWERLLAVIRLSRTLLAEDVGFLGLNGAQEERSQWRMWWNTAARPGLTPRLTPALSEIPTLTLTFDFALPAHRQPGRLRRLRIARDRRRRRLDRRTTG